MSNHTLFNVMTDTASARIKATLAAAAAHERMVEKLWRQWEVNSLVAQSAQSLELRHGALRRANIAAFQLAKLAA
jgi:hypothetical protein